MKRSCICSMQRAAVLSLKHIIKTKLFNHNKLVGYYSYCIPINCSFSLQKWFYSCAIAFKKLVLVYVWFMRPKWFIPYQAAWLYFKCYTLLTKYNLFLDLGLYFFPYVFVHVLAAANMYSGNMQKQGAILGIKHAIHLFWFDETLHRG